MERLAEIKFRRLKEVLSPMGSLLIAFSGGVDSTLLLKIAADTLGTDNVVALTAKSPAYPERELRFAVRMASVLGVKHLVVESNEIELPGFKDNSEKRCYFCKEELFMLCIDRADKLGISFVADGSNADDCLDYRPGIKAAEEMSVRSPLMEAGLSKDEIRALSRRLELETWEKPSFACLSSRFPYGTVISAEKLRRIGLCEDTMSDLGFRQFRVRYHDFIARIEIEPSDFSRLIDDDVRGIIVNKFKEQGFNYVTMDLQGYRSGSMNEPDSLKLKLNR